MRIGRAVKEIEAFSSPPGFPTPTSRDFYTTAGIVDQSSVPLYTIVWDRGNGVSREEG
jgi:hypothetical protein